MMWNWVAWNKTNQIPAVLPKTFDTVERKERSVNALYSPRTIRASI